MWSSEGCGGGALQLADTVACPLLPLTPCVQVPPQASYIVNLMGTTGLEATMGQNAAIVGVEWTSWAPGRIAFNQSTFIGRVAVTAGQKLPASLSPGSPVITMVAPIIPMAARLGAWAAAAPPAPDGSVKFKYCLNDKSTCDRPSDIGFQFAAPKQTINVFQVANSSIDTPSEYIAPGTDVISGAAQRTASQKLNTTDRCVWVGGCMYVDGSASSESGVANRLRVRWLLLIRHRKHRSGPTHNSTSPALVCCRFLPGYMIMSLYGDRMSTANVASWAVPGLIVAAEDVTDVPDFAFVGPLNDRDELVVAAAGSSWYQSIKSNAGRTPWDLPDPRPPYLQSRVQTLKDPVWLQQSTGGRTVYRYSRKPAADGKHLAYPEDAVKNGGSPFGEGTYMFGTDPTPLQREVCADEYIQLARSRTSPRIHLSQPCNTTLEAAEYAARTKHAHFAQSYRLSLGGRLWHVRVASSQSYHVSHGTSNAIIIWGVLSSLLLGALAVGVMYIHGSKSRRLQQEAAQRAHELTVSYAAHELRNPLHALSAAAALMRDDVDEISAQVQKPLLEGQISPDASAVLACHRSCTAAHVRQIADDSAVITAAAEQLHQVINDFTDLQRLRTGRFIMTPRPVELMPFLRAAIDLHKPMARVPLELAVDPAIVGVALVDPTRLQQLLSNGLSNACKHSEGPGRVIRLSGWLDDQRRSMACPSSKVDVTALPASAWHRGFRPVDAPTDATQAIAMAAATTKSKADIHGALFGRQARRPGAWFRRRGAPSDGQAPPPPSLPELELENDGTLDDDDAAGPGAGGPLTDAAAASAAGYEAVWVVFEVSDNGQGLGGRTGQSLFEPFAQGSKGALKGAGRSRKRTASLTDATGQETQRGSQTLASTRAGPPTTAPISHDQQPGEEESDGHGQQPHAAVAHVSSTQPSTTSSSSSAAALAGSGLGLALAASLVSMMGGQIALAEHDGRTRYIVRLPLQIKQGQIGARSGLAGRSSSLMPQPTADMTSDAGDALTINGRTPADATSITMPRSSVPAQSSEDLAVSESPSVGLSLQVPATCRNDGAGLGLELAPLRIPVPRHVAASFNQPSPRRNSVPSSSKPTPPPRASCTRQPAEAAATPNPSPMNNNSSSTCNGEGSASGAHPGMNGELRPAPSPDATMLAPATADSPASERPLLSSTHFARVAPRREPTQQAQAAGAGWSAGPSLASNGPCASASAPQHRACSAHVLVADDEPVNRRLVCRMLEKKGHTADAVDDGDQVEGMLVASGQLPESTSSSTSSDQFVRPPPSARPYTCILMDIMMRRTNGADVTKHLKERGLRIPVYAMTANTAPGDISHYVAVGMEPLVLGKPFSTDQMQEAVQQAMARQARSCVPVTG